MASFSERHGYKEVRSVVQRESLDEVTRMGLWNVLSVVPQLTISNGQSHAASTFLLSAWIGYFKEARDEVPSNARMWLICKEVLISSPWNDAFDLLEFVVRNIDQHFRGNMSNTEESLVRAFNQVFERELVGYRFIGQEITPIDGALEIDAVATGSEDAKAVESAHHHLGKALEHLSDRENPDYLNTIKESISAVEAIARRITGKQTLGEALGALNDAGLEFHGALLKAWGAMYGYTSDADGVRHGGDTVAVVDQALAKYILVTCSAFVSFLVEEGRKAGKL